MMKRLLILLCFAFSLMSHLQSADSNKELGQLATCIQKEYDLKHKDTVPSTSAIPNNQHMLIAQLQDAISRNDTNLIESSLLSLAGYIGSNDLQKKYDEAMAKLRKEREQRSNKILGEIKAALKKAEDATHTAPRTADFDPILNELNRLQKLRSPQDSVELISAYNELDAALNFITTWQNYYSETAAGHMEAVTGILQNLCDNRSPQPNWIPRSELLSRLHFLLYPPQPQNNDSSDNSNNPDKSKILSVEKPLRLDPVTGDLKIEVTKLSALKGAIDELRRLQVQPEFNRYRKFIGDALSLLEPINKTYLVYQSGLPTDIDFNTKVSDTDSLWEVVLPLRSQLVMLILPRFLELPPETHPKSNEGPCEFLERLNDEALQKQDYPLVARIQKVLRFLKGGSPEDPDVQSQPELFLTGNNQELTGQFDLAVTSYEKALATDSTIIPPKLIGEKLDAIKKDHPEAFKEGLDLYLWIVTLPPPSRFLLNRYRGFPSQQGMPFRQGSPKPTLPIPAAPPITSTNK